MRQTKSTPTSTSALTVITVISPAKLTSVPIAGTKYIGRNQQKGKENEQCLYHIGYLDRTNDYTSGPCSYRLHFSYLDSVEEMTTLYRIDLRPSEITLLRRACAIYGRFYQDLIVKSEPQWEKDELRLKIKASETISNRLMYDVKPADVVSPAVIARVMEELRTMDHSAFTNDVAGWERATETIIKSLIK